MGYEDVQHWHDHHASISSPLAHALKYHKRGINQSKSTHDVAAVGFMLRVGAGAHVGTIELPRNLADDAQLSAVHFVELWGEGTDGVGASFHLVEALEFAECPQETRP
jgi:hypothetical protein